MLLSLSFMHTGCSTAVVGSFCCCWAVNVACWVLAIVCHSWSSLCMVVNWAVDVFWAARVVCGGGCMMWQWATWRAHSLSLMLVTWVCDHQVWLLGSCCGLWAAGDVCGGGSYM